MNWITESSKKFQPFCHFTQSHIPFITKFFMVRVRNFCSKLHHRSLRMKITKNTAPGKIDHGVRYIFCVDTFNENAYT